MTGDIGPAAAWRDWWKTRWSELGDTPAGRLARNQGFVLATAQLRGIGWARHDLRRERRRGTWSAPARGVVSPVVIDGEGHLARRRRHALVATGDALVRAGHVISGRSAAVLHGLPTLSVPDAVELTAPARDTLGRRFGSHFYGAALPAADVGRWFGAPITSVARTVVDLARHDRRDGIIAADAALHEQLTPTAQLQAAVTAVAGWPGVRQAREVVAFADHRAESPLESLTRLAMHDDGFPAPEPQVWIGKDRVDLLLLPQRLVIECDGLEKYQDGAWTAEKVREQRLRRFGYRVERVIWTDVVTFWPQTSVRLRAA